MFLDSLHISISAQTIFRIGGFLVSNSILTSVIVSIFLISLCYLVKTKIENKTKISTFQNVTEFIVEALYNLVHSVTNDHKKTKVFLPFIMTFFLIILFNNWFGLFPGVGTVGFIEETKPSTTVEEVQAAPIEHLEAGLKETEDLHTEEINEHTEILTEVVENEHGTTDEEAVDAHVKGALEGEGAENLHTEETHGEEHKSSFVPFLRGGTADLNTTFALAIFSVLSIQFIGYQYLGFAYFKKFFSIGNPIMMFVGFLELISEFAKILSFAFRLFGNIFAGEVLLAVIAALCPIAIPLPFYFLEVFVGFIQALVFSMLTLVFYNIATISHDEHN